MTSRLEREQYRDETNRTGTLEARLGFNAKASKVDFQSWLQSLIDVAPGMNILDVGCGTGAQVVRYLERLEGTGKVCAIDLSKDSIKTLKNSIESEDLLETAVADMIDLDEVISKSFSVSRFDLITSTYSLYYAREPVAVLEMMRSHLAPGGLMSICVPVAPHGLVNLVGQYKAIPQIVSESLEIGPKHILPFFRNAFEFVTVHYLNNRQEVKSSNEMIEYLKNAPYYSSDVEKNVRHHIDAEIDKTGTFLFGRNSFLIIGKNLQGSRG